MADQQFKISVRIRHPTADISEFSIARNSPPTRIWKAGDARSTPIGTPLEGFNKNSYCVLEPDKDYYNKLEEVFNLTIDFLTNYQTDIKEITSTGGECEVCIACFMDSNGGGYVHANIINKLATLGIELQLFIYGKDTNP